MIKLIKNRNNNLIKRIIIREKLMILNKKIKNLKLISKKLNQKLTILKQ